MGTTYNQQRLLFSETKPIAQHADRSAYISEQFYENGYQVVSDIPTVEEAQGYAEHYLASLNVDKLPLFGRLLNRIQLAKADLIPVCDDVVTSNFQVLHFDMGQPILTRQPQMMVLATALYLPSDKPLPQATTRVVPLRGLFRDARWGGAEAIERKLIDYAREYGDGWADVNTCRLACFARVLDAVSGAHDLLDYRDKTMGQWFRDTESLSAEECLKNEQVYYKEKGIDLAVMEKRIRLTPGQLLIIDNTRVVHGRVGRRQAEEVYQLMYAVEKADSNDVDAFRGQLVRELAGI